MATWTIPYGDAVDFNFGGWARPQGGAVDFELGREQGTVYDPWANFRVSSPGGTAIPWGRLRRVDAGCRLPWRPASILHKECRLPWRGEAPIHPPEIRLPWNASPRADCQGLRLPWGGQNPLVTPGVRILWGARPPHLDFDFRLPWGRPDAHDRLFRVPWWAWKPRLDFEIRLPWGRLDARDQLFRIPWWGWKPPRDRLHRIYWGRELYARICLRGYDIPAGDAVVIDLRVPLAQVGDGDHVDFRFDSLTYDLRCSQREPSGWRDNYFFQPPKHGPRTPKLETLIVINTALLTRVSDGKPVPVHSMSLSADIDSWGWTFAAKVPEAALDLVMPLDEPVAVEADINGWKWRALVESWSESHAFARREYNIRGRSLSAQLTEPYAPASSGSNEQAANARQLAEAQLEYTDWTLAWDIPDWLVLAGALSYSGATPLKVIQRIAEAAGGRVQSHRTDQRLLVVPRLVGKPWEWAGGATALGINDWVVRKLSREYESRVPYNAVYVSGESQGVIAKVVRSGTAGEALAPMVTDALITAEEPARSRGTLVVGQSGKWSRERLEMPLTRAGVLPGLLEIGTLVGMEERGRTWRGQVVGVSVTVEFGAAFTVTQNVDIERYRGT